MEDLALGNNHDPLYFWGETLRAFTKMTNEKNLDKSNPKEQKNLRKEHWQFSSFFKILNFLWNHQTKCPSTNNPVEDSFCLPKNPIFNLQTYRGRSRLDDVFHFVKVGRCSSMTIKRFSYYIHLDVIYWRLYKAPTPFIQKPPTKLDFIFSVQKNREIQMCVVKYKIRQIERGKKRNV